MPFLFPSWWNPNAEQRRILHTMKVYTTRDLIVAAHRHHGRIVNVDEKDPVTIEVDELYRFCRSSIAGMNMHLKTAFQEACVVVSGRRPDTTVSHVPAVRRVNAKVSSSRPPPPTDDVFTDCYGWEEEEEGQKTAIPDECVCPLSLDPFVDPVCAADGFTYERKDMEAWLRSHSTSPMTGDALTTRLLFPNHRMRQLVNRLSDLPLSLRVGV